MKKLLIILLTVISLTVGGMPVFAAEYDANVTMPEIFYYDSGNTEDDTNLFRFSVSVRNLEKYKNTTVRIDYNKDIFEIAEWCVPDNLVHQSVSETETGLCFNASFFESFLDRNDEANKNTTGTCAVFLRAKATGNHDIKISATATRLDGSVKDLRVSYPEVYEEVIEKKTLDFLMLDEENVNNYYAVFDGAITVSEVVEAAKAETVVVINSANQILKEDEYVPNGMWVATTHNGFVVEKMQICVKGDVNCDGKITAADARLVLRRAAKLEQFSDNMQVYAADMNDVNGVTSYDARLILRKAAGLD